MPEVYTLRASLGSSPLTRGKLGIPPAKLAVARLIPAHAGKTHIQRQGQVKAGAHPRSRGENMKGSD